MTNAWSRQLAFPAGGYVSPLPQVWADVRVRDSKRTVRDRELGGSDLLGNRRHNPNPEQRVRAAIQRLTAIDPAVAKWWRELTPTQANAAVEQLLAQREAA